MNVGVKLPCDEGAIRSPDCCSPCGASARRWILAAAILGSSMAFIDGTVANLALPRLQQEFNASIAQVQWVVEAYALFLAALILVGGSLGDRYGRRSVFTIGVVVFGLASLWCGLAGSVTQLILARGFQGIGGAMLVPGSLAIISASFPDAERGRAIGIWSAFSAIAAGSGPILGGWLVENLSWRWAFLLNIPLAVAVIVIARWRVPESRDESVSSGLDWTGALLSVIGLTGIVYGLIEIGPSGWSSVPVLFSLLIGVAALTAFVLHERTTTNPMMPPGLFASRTFSGANLLTLFLYSALGALFFFLPLNLIQVQGYSATAAGAATAPMILLMFMLSRWSGSLADRYGGRLPLTVGPMIAALGFALCAYPGIGGPYWTTFFPGILILGIGMAISVAPLTSTVMGAVDRRRAGIASGVNNAVSRAAILLSNALLSAFVSVAFNRSLDARLSAINAPQSAWQHLETERLKLAAAQPPAELAPAVQQGIDDAIKRSFVDAFRLVALLAALLALASAVSAWVLIDERRMASETASATAAG